MKDHSENSQKLPQTSVPVYSCTIYVKELADGSVAARCVNLDGFAVTANTEPNALRELISRLKAELGRLHEQQLTVSWRAEVDPPDEGESERFTVLHL